MTEKGAYNVLLQAWQGNKESENYPDFDDICEALTIIGESLERLEQLEKAQDLKIENLKLFVGENKYQVAIRVLKEAFIVLGKADIVDTCWFKYLEELEKENQELKEEKKYYKDKYLDLYNSYQNCEDLKRKKAIEILKDYISFEVILNICDDEEKKVLNEVFEV